MNASLTEKSKSLQTLKQYIESGPKDRGTSERRITCWVQHYSFSLLSLSGSLTLHFRPHPTRTIFVSQHFNIFLLYGVCLGKGIFFIPGKRGGNQTKLKPSSAAVLCRSHTSGLEGRRLILASKALTGWRNRQQCVTSLLRKGQYLALLSSIRGYLPFLPVWFWARFSLTYTRVSTIILCFWTGIFQSFVLIFFSKIIGYL